MWVIQIKSKPLRLSHQNDLNVTLEPTVFEMDAVIVSAFNKIQSQNVMKVEHKTIKELQQKDSLIEGLATIPGVSQVSTGTSIETSNTWLSGNRVLVYSQGVRMENQQFGTNMVWV
jgi:iron complex outermembrane receptor protein